MDTTNTVADRIATERTRKQPTERNVAGQRHELAVYDSTGNVSWKYAHDGKGTRSLRASTVQGGSWLELRLTETHFPSDTTKRATTRETYMDLTRESAAELRDLLNVMLG